MKTKTSIQCSQSWDVLRVMFSVEAWLIANSMDLETMAPVEIVYVADSFGIKVADPFGQFNSDGAFWLTVLLQPGGPGTDCRLATEDEIKDYHDEQWKLC